MSTYAPFAKPLYVMLKPVGAVCNLACDSVKCVVVEWKHS